MLCIYGGHCRFRFPRDRLKIAVNVFWRLGYEHTSLETLMRGKGLSTTRLETSDRDPQHLANRIR
jgi:hypothetical protein